MPLGLEENQRSLWIKQYFRICVWIIQSEALPFTRPLLLAVALAKLQSHSESPNQGIKWKWARRTKNSSIPVILPFIWDWSIIKILSFQYNFWNLSNPGILCVGDQVITRSKMTTNENNQLSRYSMLEGINQFFTCLGYNSQSRVWQSSKSYSSDPKRFLLQRVSFSTKLQDWVWFTLSEQQHQ